jgi:hypothetical protein
VPKLLEAAWPHIAEARAAEAAAMELHEEELPRLKPGPAEEAAGRPTSAAMTTGSPPPAGQGGRPSAKPGSAHGDHSGEGRAADRPAPPDDLPDDYNPALVPPVKGGGRGKGSRKR